MMKTALRVGLAAPCMLSLSMFSATAADEDHPGRKLWDRGKCHVCHGKDGHADTPAGKKLGARDLSSDEVQKLTDDEIATILKDGKDKMPAWGDVFTDEEIRLLVEFVRTFATAK